MTTGQLHKRDREELRPRSYPSTMLMPFFPEPTGASQYHTDLGSTTVSIFVEGETDTIATPSDRRILHILPAILKRQIDEGNVSRHLTIKVSELIIQSSEAVLLGGEDYTRIREKLERLMATVIETSELMPNGMRRTKRFRWVDKFQYDSDGKNIGPSTHSVTITLSEDVYSMMVDGTGFDTPNDVYRSVVSQPSSTWRIYEICLATVLQNDLQESVIPMSELHMRIPLQCPLKNFRSRALKNAMNIIAQHEEMSRRIKLALVRKTDDGFEEVPAGKRVLLTDVFIQITPVDLSDIKQTSMLTQHTQLPEEQIMIG